MCKGSQPLDGTPQPLVTVHLTSHCTCLPCVAWRPISVRDADDTAPWVLGKYDQSADELR